MRRARFLLPGLLLAVLGAAAACGGAKLPDPVYPVRDDGGVLDAAALGRVRAICESLERETSAEIGVLIIATTEDEVASEYGVRVFNHWGVGKKGKNNGVLLLFAMEDRRVELIPGIGYRALFSRAEVEALLDRVVVPQMRAGKPAEAIEGCVREVAAWIRRHEPPAAVPVALPPSASGTEPLPLEAAEPAAPSRAYGSGTTILVDSSGATVPPPREIRWLPILATIGAWLAFGALAIWILVRTFRTGRLAVPKPVVFLLLIAAPIIYWVSTAGLAADESGVSYVNAGGTAGSLILGGVARHICTRCNKWCTIRTRTLVSPTYTSSGTGERTYHCEHCGYHHVGTYTISKLTKSSGSRSSSGGSRSSFGGGRSSGGGGGRSW